MAHLDNFLCSIRLLLASPFIIAVRLYRITLSPDHGLLKPLFPYGYCRHEPTCSSYALEKLRIRWLPVALILIVLRVVNCHPWRKPSTERMRKIIEKTM